MKKLERYIYIALIIILVSIVCTGATYIVMNGKNNNKTEIKENINQEKDKEKAPEIDLANSIKFKEIKTINDKIVEYFDVVLNNKKSIFEIEYTYEKNQSGVAMIKGKLPNTQAGFLVDFINNEDNDSTFESFINENFNSNKLKTKITENNFQFIKGEDNKDYLLVVSESENFSGNPSAYLYAYDDEKNLVTGDVNYTSCSTDNEKMAIVYGPTSNETVDEPGKSGYKNGFNLTKDYYGPINVKIEGNKVYYLKANYNMSNDEIGGILEERIYTIKNSKWVYTLKSKFKIINIAGEVC